jgi:hypothetical protein
MMGKLSSNPKEARHDIALILAIKYKEEMGRANGRTMLTTPIEEKYDTIAKVLFKSKFKSLLNYVIKNEPGFDPRATSIAQGKTPLGFVGADATYDEKGNVRAPLGFVKKPQTLDEDGNVQPGLGFLDEGNGSRGGLGFL